MGRLTGVECGEYGERGVLCCVVEDGEELGGRRSEIVDEKIPNRARAAFMAC